VFKLFEFADMLDHIFWRFIVRNITVSTRYSVCYCCGGRYGSFVMAHKDCETHEFFYSRKCDAYCCKRKWVK
jgi:hypothetical protein